MATTATASCALLLFLARHCGCISLTSLHESERVAGSVPGNEITESYFWPTGRGHVGRYSVSQQSAPFDLKGSLAWTWHDPTNRYAVSPVGVNIDNHQNIYMTALDGIRKFSPDGLLLWEYLPDRGQFEEMPDTASLYNGAVYCATTEGRIRALNMETGSLLWETKVDSCDGTNSWVSAHDGVVILGSDVNPVTFSDGLVRGLNATDGSKMWTFKPDAPVWNFMASFAGDGTFVFQDLTGRAYRNRVSDGSLIWKNGGGDPTWTDGTALLGSNNVVYAVNTHSTTDGGPDAHGDVSAYALEDGHLLWRWESPRPPNNQPAIGRLHGQTGLSLIQPIGQQVLKGAPTDVYALDAATGAVQWVFRGPVEAKSDQAGDDNEEARKQRKAAGERELTRPNPWSAPAIDSQGTVFIGNEEGQIFALKNEDGNSVVEGASEVSTYETKACFSGSSSPAFGENLMAIANIDAMYVFKR